MHYRPIESKYTRINFSEKCSAKLMFKANFWFHNEYFQKAVTAEWLKTAYMIFPFNMKMPYVTNMDTCENQNIQNNV